MADLGAFTRKALDAIASPVRQRAKGERPGALRAAAGATVAGAATGVVVYRLLRQ